MGSNIKEALLWKGQTQGRSPPRLQSVPRRNCKYQLSSTRYKLAISRCHCPPPAAVPSLQGHTVNKPSPGCTNILQMLYISSNSLPRHRERRGAEVKSSHFEVLGEFRLYSNAKYFYIIPRHFCLYC